MMLRLILTLILTTHLLSAQEIETVGLTESSPEEIATLNSKSDFLIAGYVHPLSGGLCMSSLDLIAKGAQDIELFRVYIPPQIELPDPTSSEIVKYYKQRDFLLSLQKKLREWEFRPYLRL